MHIFNRLAALVFKYTKGITTKNGKLNHETLGLAPLYSSSYLYLKKLLRTSLKNNSRDSNVN